MVSARLRHPWTIRRACGTWKRVSRPSSSDMATSCRARPFSPDGQRIVTASDDNTAGIWDAQIGERIVTLSGRTAVFSPDGRSIVTSDGDTARIWNADSGKLATVLGGHWSRVTRRRVQPRWSIRPYGVRRQNRAAMERQDRNKRADGRSGGTHGICGARGIQPRWPSRSHAIR